MSVIYRTPDGEIKLLCKGAVSHSPLIYEYAWDLSLSLSLLSSLSLSTQLQDSVIYERMTGSQEWLSGETEKHLVHFAIDGLRTLCIAERRIEESLYLVDKDTIVYHRIPFSSYDLIGQEWNERYHGASISLSNREEELDKVAEEIEKAC